MIRFLLRQPHLRIKAGELKNSSGGYHMFALLHQLPNWQPSCI
jgi:hypothetical protein